MNIYEFSLISTLIDWLSVQQKFLKISDDELYKIINFFHDAPKHFSLHKVDEEPRVDDFIKMNHERFYNEILQSEDYYNLLHAYISFMEFININNEFDGTILDFIDQKHNPEMCRKNCKGIPFTHHSMV